MGAPAYASYARAYQAGVRQVAIAENLQLDAADRSLDNDIADGLSRGGEMLANALRIASAPGIKVRRLASVEKWRDLTALRYESQS